MTSWVPDIDGSQALLAELRGDSRFTDSDTPPPAYVARIRDNTAAPLRTATLATTQDPS